MTAPAYHVGQILYHRASGERAIVVTMPDDSRFMWLSAGIGHKHGHMILVDEAEITFSTEPVFIKTASEPDLTFRPVNKYRKPNA